ncbi:alpha/beta hydrolase [Corynebacterium aurimucosum]|uniref:alpha/beta hydrolase n=1 Tax=Corynebacterium aurimucosum TaxID=169292 RepID=UPI0039903DC7
MSASAALRAETNRIETFASELELYIDDAHHNWADLALSGAAADAARRALQRATDTLLEPAQQMRLAARILSLYAPLQERIEQLRARALQLAAVPAFAEPASVVLGQLDALADVLDWACARQLNALCTPEMAQPPSRLEDFSDLTLTELHQVQLTMASEEVRSLAAANPDLTVLEASPGRLVALVDPEGIGTHAAQVSTFVSGVGSSETASWPTAVERARAIARATNGPTVAWIGYSAPASLPRAAHEDPARRGAAELGRFQRALRQRFPHAQHILLGYSYGSVVVGKAAQQDYVADDIVLVGSPGASVDSASHLHGRVWSARNTEDPIAIATGPRGGIHGPDPSSPPFGAAVVPGTSSLPGDHGSYWKDPAFLQGLSIIARRF